MFNVKNGSDCRMTESHRRLNIMVW